MPDEIVVKPKSESEPVAAPTTVNQPVSLTRTHLTNLCAAGLGVSFFLPWANVLFGTLSGFDLQKSGDGQLLLWAIPFFSVITIIAGLAKRSQQIVGPITGALPFIVGIYWYVKIQNDLFHILTYGAFLSLGFGVALFVLPCKKKQS